MTNCTQLLIPYYRLVYTGIFLPCVIFSLLHLQTFLPRLEFTQTQLCSKRDNLGQWNSPSLNFAP